MTKLRRIEKGAVFEIHCIHTFIHYDGRT